MSSTETTIAATPIGLTDRAPTHARWRWSRRVAADLVAFVDAATIVASAFVPAFVYAHTAGITPHWTTLLQVSLATAIIAAMCLRGWRAYEPTELHDLPLMPDRLLAALAIAMLALLGLGLPFVPRDANLWIWYSLWLSSSFTLLLAARLLSRTVLSRLTAAGLFDTRIAVYGAGIVARRVHDHLATGVTGIRFVGVFDDRAGTDRINPDGLTVDGTLANLIAAGRNEQIDQIIIALPQSADNRMSYIVRQLQQLPVSIHIVTHLASDLIDNVLAHKVSAIGPVGMIDVKKKPLSDWAPIVKQIEDYLLASLLAIVALPICALVALAVRLESPGPVLFVQRRHGLNKRIINVYKFRTMTVMQDGHDIPQATTHDPRITRLGRILRRTSLDELPQLLNVLKGEMSLVGPRPHALVHDEQWSEMLERYANRHQVKPGITGLAQVNGFRGQMDTPDKIKARVDQDLAYIQNWSLWLDLKILARTILAVITAKNAQ